MGQEWNYMQCNQCYVMFPHLAVPEVCVCGNDMNCNSTRKKFILSFRVKEFIEKLKEKATKPIYLDFDKNRCPGDSKHLAYCGGCNGDFVEAGCTCGLIDINEIDKLAKKELFVLHAKSEGEQNG